MKFLCVFLLAVTVSMCVAVPCTSKSPADSTAASTERAKREVNAADAPATTTSPDASQKSKREALPDHEDNAEKSKAEKSKDEKSSKKPKKGKKTTVAA